MKVTLPQTAIIVVWHLSYPLSTHMHTHTHTHTVLPEGDCEEDAVRVK